MVRLLDFLQCIDSETCVCIIDEKRNLIERNTADNISREVMNNKEVIRIIPLHEEVGIIVAPIEKDNHKKIRFVVFLDVDGVLNTRRTCVYAPSGTYVGVDEARIAILAKSMKENCVDGVVLTTTWKNMREDNEDFVYLVESLDKYGIKILGKTKEERDSQRADGILSYLKLHPEIEEFVILDDQHFEFDGYSKLWESFIDTHGRGIEYGSVASKTPSISARLFMDAIKKYS